MIDFIGVIIQGFFDLMNKENRIIRKNRKLLLKEKWFNNLFNKYGFKLYRNPVIKQQLSQKNIEVILKDIDKTRDFRLQIEQLITKENL